MFISTIYYARVLRENTRMKMPRPSKTNVDVHVEMPRQIMPEYSLEKPVITVPDPDSTSDAARERRKKDAGKLLYLRRI